MVVVTRELAHHGILGQKWGIRRYQNKDGSLTDLGRKRLAKKELKRDGGEYQKQETEFNKEMVIAKGDYKKAIEHLEVFTEQELDTIISRHDREIKLRDFKVKDLKAEQDAAKNAKDRKMEKFDRAVKITQNAANMATNVSNLYTTIAKASNAIFDTHLPVIGEKKEINRGVKITKNVTYEDIPGITNYVKKITNTTTENKDGTTSHDTTTEWVGKGNQGLSSVADDNKEDKKKK